MNLKKGLIVGLLGVTTFVGSMGIGFAQDVTYKVQSGDTFWLISQKFDIAIDPLMKANNSNENTVLNVGQNLIIPKGETHTVQRGDTFWIISQKYGVDIHELMAMNNATENTTLNIGDILTIPSKEPVIEQKTYTVQRGDTYWIIANKYGVDTKALLAFNGANESSVLYIGQTIKIPTSTDSVATTQSSGPTITYTTYKVQQGDDFWKIGLKFGIPYTEVLSANNMKEGTQLNIGDGLKIPIHHVPVKETPGEKYGETLDWWTEAQYVVPVGSVFKVVDFYSGKSFMAKRTTGANHADVETLTEGDTKIMTEIWRGILSWDSRPVIIEYNGRKLAASAASMPHAGNDNDPGGLYTSWRSGGYDGGFNFDWVKNNGIHGVFDIHFKNSTRHKDGQVDPTHQQNIEIAGGVK